MKSGYTIAFAAKALNRTPQAIRKLCAKHGLGTKVHSRLRLLTDRELQRLVDLVRTNGRTRT